MRLLMATGNAGKLREVRGLLAPEGVEVLGLRDLADAPEVVEDGDTFLANARTKAWTLARVTRLPVLADDSGLAVAALDGRPGVRSARYAGPDADDAANNARLLRELAGVPPARRGAEFVCAMVLAVPGSEEREFVAEGRLPGTLLDSGRGSDGFGYDPLFLEASTGRTLAELDLATKNGLSHRHRALAQLLPPLRDLAREAAAAPRP
jgi:XTP/dITP diphosphohydrolase